MAFNGSGTYVLPGAALVDGQTISATEHNTFRDDVATALSTCVTRNGQSPATANIPMGNFKHTGLGSGSARTESVNLGQVQDGVLNWVAAGGTADAITATYSPAITALVDGQVCFVRAASANATTTPTFSPSGLTARTIVMQGGGALYAGSIKGAGHEMILRYNLANTRWELLNPNYEAAATYAGLVNLKAGADIASAATVDLTAATGNTVTITGTVAITALTMNDGQHMTLVAAGALPLTYNATTMNIQGGASYTCVAGEVVHAFKKGTVIYVFPEKRTVSFAATKVSGAQAISNATYTKVTFDTEDSDSHGTFASSTWTPGKLGMATVSASIFYNTSVDQAPFQILIYKNGAAYRSIDLRASGTGAANPSICTGIPITALTDTIEIYAYQASGGSVNISAAPAYTNFSGKI